MHYSDFVYPSRHSISRITDARARARIDSASSNDGRKTLTALSLHSPTLYDGILGVTCKGCVRVSVYTLSDGGDRGGSCAGADRSLGPVAGAVIREGWIHGGRLLLDHVVGRVAVAEDHRSNHAVNVLVRPGAEEDPLGSAPALRPQVC